MPQNDCERWFCHVMTFAPFIWNAPKSNNFIFGSFSVLKLITCEKSEMPHFSMSEIFEMPHFSLFQNQIGFWRGFWGISNKWGKCHHMTKSSFTCVLGHFILPPYRTSIIYTKQNINFSLWTSVFYICKKIKILPMLNKKFLCSSDK